MSGSLLPTEQPFLYTVSATATDGTPLQAVEAALVEELERVRRDGITPVELARAQTQLRARILFESDSISNIAHQIGYFATIATPDVYTTLSSRVSAVTLEMVADAARRLLGASNRTVGWFEPSGE